MTTVPDIQAIHSIQLKTGQMKELVQTYRDPNVVATIENLCDSIIELTMHFEKIYPYREMIQEFIDHCHPDGSGWSYERIQRAKELLAK